MCLQQTPVPFTQSIQYNGVVSVPAHSDVVSPPQVVTTKLPTYPNFYFSDAMSSKLRQAIYATSDVKTPDGNTVPYLEWTTCHGIILQKLTADTVNCKTSYYHERLDHYT